MTEGLRIVACVAYYPTHRLVAEWAKRYEHELVLLVVPPVPRRIPFSAGRIDVLHDVSPKQDVLITDRMRTTATKAVRALEPDLLVSAIFPRLLPPELTSASRLGAVNLHPTALPRGRGPNTSRLLYEGNEQLGAALHRTEAEFDNGAILAMKERPLPEVRTTREVFLASLKLQAEVLDEGVRRLLRGEWGDPQDEALATYNAQYEPRECWLDITEPASTLQLKTIALNQQVPVAVVKLEDRTYVVMDIAVEPDPDEPDSPGTILERSDRELLVQTGKGLARMDIRAAGL